MKIAIDKNSLKAVKNNKNEYIYLFDDEPLDDLIKTKLHCINYRYAKYVDINLTDYEIDGIKKSNLKEKDYDKLPKKKDFFISIIIPNYNFAEWLSKCFDSIFL